MILDKSYLSYKEVRALEKAEREARKREFKRELYKIKYGSYPKVKQPMGYSKKLTTIMTILLVSVIYFSMFATIYLRDISALAPAIGALIAQVGNMYMSNKKSIAENTIGGIQYERMVQEYNLKNETNNIESTTDEAVG